jgi:hypothetical protein
VFLTISSSQQLQDDIRVRLRSRNTQATGSVSVLR